MKKSTFEEDSFCWTKDLSEVVCKAEIEYQKEKQEENFRKTVLKEPTLSKRECADSGHILSSELSCSPYFLFPQNSTPKSYDVTKQQTRFSKRLAEKQQHSVSITSELIEKSSILTQRPETLKQEILSSTTSENHNTKPEHCISILSPPTDALSNEELWRKKSLKQHKIENAATLAGVEEKDLAFNSKSKNENDFGKDKSNSSHTLPQHNPETNAQNSSSFFHSQDKLNLSSWGLPDEVLQNYKENGVSQMFPWQVECLSLPGVLEGHNLVYSAPTSAGKTLIAEIILLKRVLEMGKKGIFILPFVSVAREKTFYLQRLFGTLGVKVEGFMGGQSPPGGFQNTDIAICTIEKANNLINRLIEDQKVKSLGIVVVDELHMVGDPQRGYLVELLLTKLQYVSSSNKSSQQLQIIGMSATLPNLHVLANWLRAQLYSTSYRPIPLLQMVKIGSLLYRENFTVLRDLRSSTEIIVKDDQDHLMQLCLETVLEGFSVLLFCPTKAWCEKIALSIASTFFSIGKGGSKYPDTMVSGLRERLNGKDLWRVIQALTGCPAGLDPVLEKALAFGAGFHHAGLTFDERDILEGAFRAGYVPVLVATSTLSSGVNLPARRVIVRSPNSGGSQVMDPLVYKQMIGRAGRKGKDTQGESILMCANNERHKAERLVSSSLPPITSCLQRHSTLSASIKRAVLEIVVSGAAKTANEIRCYWNCTLLAASIKDAQETDESYNEVSCQPAVEESVKYLLDNELARCLEETDGEVSYVGTQLGSAILASGLSPDEGLHVFSELQRARQCFVLENELHVVYQVTPVYVSGSWPNLDWLCFLQLWDGLSPGMKRVGELVGIEESFIVRAMKGIVNSKIPKQQRMLAIHQRFYAAMALHDLVHEVKLSAVVCKYGATKGLLQALQQSAATFAGMVTIFCNRLGWHNLELLIAQYQNRLQFGIQRDLCDLVRISLLNGRRARLLFDAGLETVAQIAHSNCKNVENILLNAGPFQSCKDETRGFILGPNGRPLSIAEASKSIVDEARHLVQKELNLDFIDWSQRASNKVCAILRKEKRNLDTPKVTSSPSHSSIRSNNLASSNTPSPVLENVVPTSSEHKEVRKNLKLSQEFCEEKEVRGESIEENVGSFTTKKASAMTLQENNSTFSESLTSKSNNPNCFEGISKLKNRNDSPKELDSQTCANEIPNERSSKDNNLTRPNSNGKVQKSRAKGIFLFAKPKKEQSSSNDSRSIYIPESQESPLRRQNVSARRNSLSKSKQTSNNRDIDPEAPLHTETSPKVTPSAQQETKSTFVMFDSLKAGLLEDDIEKSLEKPMRDRTSTQSEDLFDMSEIDERRENSANEEISKLNQSKEGDLLTQINWSQWSQNEAIKRNNESNSGSVKRVKIKNMEKKKDESMVNLYSVCMEQLNFTFSDPPSPEELVIEKVLETKQNTLPTSESKLAIDSHIIRLTENNLSPSNSQINSNCSFQNLVTTFSSQVDNSLKTDVNCEESLVFTEAGELSLTRENIEENLNAFETSIVKSCRENALNDAISGSLLEITGEEDFFQTKELEVETASGDINDGNSSDKAKRGKNNQHTVFKEINPTNEVNENEKDVDEGVFFSPLRSSSLNCVDKNSSPSGFDDFSSIMLTPGIEAVLQGKIGTHKETSFVKKDKSIANDENRLPTQMLGPKLSTKMERKSGRVRKNISNLTFQRAKQSPLAAKNSTVNINKSFGFPCEVSDTEVDDSIRISQETRSSNCSKTSQESTRSLCIIDVANDRKLFDVFVDEWKRKEQFALCLACEKAPSQQSKGGIGWRFCGRSRRTASQKQPVAGMVIQQTNLLLTGIAVSWGSTDAYYINLKTTHEETINNESRGDVSFSTTQMRKDVPLSQRVNAIKDILCNKMQEKTIVMWQVKESLKRLHRSGIGFSWANFQEPKVAAWLLDPSDKEKNLHNMVINYLDEFSYLLEDIGKTVGTESIGICASDDNSNGSVRVRSAIESVLVFHLNEALAQKLDQVKLRKVWESVEMPTIFNLALLELNGIGFSHSACQHQKILMQEKLNLLESEAFRLVGHPFALSSPDEVAKVLYLELRLAPTNETVDMVRGKKALVTKRGRRVGGPTNKEALEKLQENHPLPKIILEWRKIKAALTKVVYPLCNEMVVCGVSGEERIFPISYTFTATGRITFHEPNIQNIPKDFLIELPTNLPSMSTDSKGSKRSNDMGSVPMMRQLAPILDPLDPSSSYTISLRNAIVAGKGRLLLAADYCQVELRLLAHLSADEGLLSAVNGGEDVFKTIAAQIHSVSASDVSDTLRQEAKQICYGIIYGMGEKALGEQLGITEQAAHDFVTKFYQRFPGIRQFVKKTLDKAREQGFVSTMDGRRRFFPSLLPSSTASAMEKGQSERQAVNTRIQGSAADLIKKAMIAIQKNLDETFPDCPLTMIQPQQRGQLLSGAFLVLQLHDELIYEVVSEDVIQVAQIIKQHMEAVCSLSVQLPVKIKVGPTWGSVQTLNL